MGATTEADKKAAQKALKKANAAAAAAQKKATAASNVTYSAPSRSGQSGGGPGTYVVWAIFAAIVFAIYKVGDKCNDTTEGDGAFMKRCFGKCVADSRIVSILGVYLRYYGTIPSGGLSTQTGRTRLLHTFSHQGEWRDYSRARLCSDCPVPCSPSVE